MRISQKIGLSFAAIFALVFILGAIAILSLRQIYQGAYESLSQDMPAIREVAFLGIQWADTQQNLQIFLRSMDPKDWQRYRESDQETQKILKNLSSHTANEEGTPLQEMMTTDQELQSLAEQAKKYKGGWTEIYQEFLKTRDSLLVEITSVIQLEQSRLAQEQDLLLIQSQYIPVLDALNSLRGKSMDFSSALEQWMSTPETLQQEKSKALGQELQWIAIKLKNYVFTQEEQQTQEKMQQQIELFLGQSVNLSEQHLAILGILRRIGGLRDKTQTLFSEFIEQEKGEVARKTGLAAIFIEEIPSTRASAYLAIESSRALMNLETYLLTSQDEDRRRYEQSKSETQRHLTERMNFARARKQQQFLDSFTQTQTKLAEQSQQVLYLNQEQKNQIKKLQQLLEEFETQTNHLLSSDFESIGKLKEVATAQKEIAPKISLAMKVLQAVSDSIGNLNRYPMTGNLEAKGIYELKLLEIIQGLDQLKQITPELQKSKVATLEGIFNQLRNTADQLISLYENQQSRLKDKKELEAELRKNMTEVLHYEEEKNLLAREQLERKVTLINLVIVLIVLGVGILGGFVIIYARRAITQPIQELSEGAKVIGSGKLNYRLQIETGDELQDLAIEFNKMTQELQGLYTNLEQKVEERTHQLALANQALAESNRELDDFTYIVSHDLKEPLRGIDAFSRFLIQDVGEKLDAKNHEYLNSIADAAKRMSRLIADLLDLSRITRQQNPFEETNLSGVLEDVRKDLVYALTEKKVDLKIGDLPAILCDRVRIQQVFYNLISNAIKYNDKANPIIEVGSTPKGNRYEFYIRDNGMGIKKEYFDKVFNIFQRLPGSEKVEGTGAGLAIVKKIVEKHGGKIWLDSSPGSGTTFYVTLLMEPIRTQTMEPVP